MWPFILFCLSFLIGPHSAHAGRVPFQVRYPQSHALSRRAGNSSVPITNTFNAEYISTITLGAGSFPVLLDTGKSKMFLMVDSRALRVNTGSSDLWVAGNIPQTTSLGKTETLTYAIGKASGGIEAATLEFGGYTVNNQTYRTGRVSFRSVVEFLTTS